ncbi:MAG: efflux RND transporter periplasmic adaptor subunit [bacterium]
MDHKRILLGILIVAVVLIAGYYQFNGDTGAKKAEYRKTEVKRGNLTRVVTSTGRVVSNFDVEIKSKATGEVVNLPYAMGDVVEKGDLLMELDPEDEQRRLRQAEIDLEVSEARLEDARRHKQRVKELYREGHESLETLEDARLSLVEAKTQYERNQIELDLARTRLDETKLHSPMEGVVSERFVQVGQIITSGASETADGTPILKLADHEPLFVYASVSENEIGRVSVGDSVEITVDAYPDRVFWGEVIRLAPSGTVEGNVVTFETRIKITDENFELLRPQMTANVDIMVEKQTDVLTLPVAAVEYRSGDRFVRRYDKQNDEFEELEVEVGLETVNKIEIISGLEVGDRVMLNPELADKDWEDEEDGGRRRGIF